MTPPWTRRADVAPTPREAADHMEPEARARFHFTAGRALRVLIDHARGRELAEAVEVVRKVWHWLHGQSVESGRYDLGKVASHLSAAVAVFDRALAAPAATEAGHAQPVAVDDTPLSRAVDTLNDWLAELDVEDPDGPLLALPDDARRLVLAPASPQAEGESAAVRPVDEGRGFCGECGRTEDLVLVRHLGAEGSEWCEGGLGGGAWFPDYPGPSVDGDPS